jgi:hypothetical protein
VEMLLAILWLALNLELACRTARTFQARASFLHLATALGCCTLLWCLLVAGLSLAGQLRPAAIQVCLAPALGLLVYRPLVAGYVAELVRPWTPGFRLGIASALTVLAVAATAPNTHWDVHTYHYTMPSLYLRHGGLYHTEVGSYNGLVGTCHLVYTVAMGWGGEMSANFCGILYLLLLGCSLAALTAEVAPLALLMLLGSPLFIVQSNGGLTDLPSAAYSMLLLAHFLEQRWAWSALWALVLVLAKLTGVLALVSLWPLVWQHSRRLVWVSLVLGVLAIPPVLWYSPLGDDWEWRYLLNGSADAMTRALLTELPGWNLRRWQETLSPCILPGLIASLALAGPHRRIVVALGWACLLSGLLHLHSPRYALSMAVWSLVPATIGWAVLWKSGGRLARSTLVIGLGVSLMLSAASLVRPLAAALGWPDRQSYLDARIAPLEAYRWLASQPYQRPLVLDSRVYLAPVPCRVLGAEQMASWKPDDIIRHVLEINPDLILWNTHSDLTMGGLLGRAYWLNGEKELLPEEWLTRIEPQRLQSIPYVLGSWKLDARGQVLYMATRFAPVVYHRNGMLATLCPREDLVRFLKDPSLRRKSRRR